MALLISISREKMFHLPCIKCPIRGEVFHQAFKDIGHRVFWQVLGLKVLIYRMPALNTADISLLEYEPRFGGSDRVNLGQGKIFFSTNGPPIIEFPYGRVVSFPTSAIDSQVEVVS